MVSGKLSAPAGMSIVKPVSGIEIRPPDRSTRCETFTGVLPLLLHHRACSSRSAAALVTELVTEPAPEPLSAAASRGAVRLWRAGSAQEAIRSAPTSEPKDLKSLRRSILGPC